MSSFSRCVRLAPLAALAFAFNAHAQVPTSCANFSLSTPISSAPSSSGAGLSVNAGDTFTFTLTAGTASSAAWRIVNDGSGSPASTLTGGGILNGSLTYVAPATGMLAIGYYVDAINGTGTITASCQAGAPHAVPASTPMSLALGAAILALAAGLFLRRRA